MIRHPSASWIEAPDKTSFTMKYRQGLLIRKDNTPIETNLTFHFTGALWRDPLMSGGFPVVPKAFPCYNVIMKLMSHFGLNPSLPADPIRYQIVWAKNEYENHMVRSHSSGWQLHHTSSNVSKFTNTNNKKLTKYYVSSFWKTKSRRNHMLMSTSSE